MHYREGSIGTAPSSEQVYFPGAQILMLEHIMIEH